MARLLHTLGRSLYGALCAALDSMTACAPEATVMAFYTGGAMMDYALTVADDRPRARPRA
jgi:hypothetical protein